MSPPGAMLSNSQETENICVGELEKLNLEEKNKFVGEIEFDLGVVDSPTYGTAHIKGTLPLVSKPGTYPLENDPAWKKETEDEAFEIISSWFTKHRLNLGTKEERDGMIRNGIRSVTLVFPPRKLNPRMLAAMCLITATYYSDDVEEETGIISEFAGLPMNESGDELTDTFSNILRGKYKSLPELPKIAFPLLKPIMWFTFLAYEQLSTIPDYDSTQLALFIRDVNKTYEASLILANPDFLDACSEEFYSEIRQFDLGGGTSLEYVYFCEQIQIRKEIRSKLAFKSCFTLGRKLGALINDLMGLKKDLHVDRPVNSILRNVRRKGISLKESVDETVEKIKGITQDIVMGFDMLGQQYPECEALVQCTKFLMDGHIFLYELSDNDDESKANKRWEKPIMKKIYY